METNVKEKTESLSINISQVPEFVDAQQTQEQLVAENPYIKITDNETYEIAKARRTALRKGRTNI